MATEKQGRFGKKQPLDQIAAIDSSEPNFLDAARHINVRERKRTNQLRQWLGTSAELMEREMGRFQPFRKQEISDGLNTDILFAIS